MTSDPRWHFGGRYGYEIDVHFTAPVSNEVAGRLMHNVQQLVGDMETYRRIGNIPSLSRTLRDANGNVYEYGFRMGRPYAVVYPASEVVVQQKFVSVYRGLAYAASVPDTDGEFGEHFRYPYDGTTNNYGTRTSYLNSAAPNTLTYPNGLSVRQTVARLVARKDGAYADKVRGILEGGRIQPLTQMPYWVKERKADGTFADTDEVWTNAGDTVWSDNMCVGGYYISGDLPYRSMVFPYDNFLIIAATTGFAGWVPRLKNPLIDADGLTVDIILDGSNYHPRAATRSSASSFIPWPDAIIQPAVNQSGTKFAIYDGAGFGKEYTLSVASGEPVATETFSVSDGFSYALPTPYWIYTGPTTGGPSIANPFDTVNWPTGTLSVVVNDGAGGYYKADTESVDGPVVGAEYAQVWTRDYSNSLVEDNHTLALAYVDDALTPVMAHTKVGAQIGSYTNSIRRRLWSQSRTSLGFSLPAGHSVVASSAYTSVPSIVPGSPPGYSGSGRAVVEEQYAISATGLTSGRVVSVATFAGDILLRELTGRYNTFEYSYSSLGYTPVTISSSTYFGQTIDDFNVDAGVTEYHQALTVDATLKDTTRTILLLDEHNEVLVYFEAGDTRVLSGSFSIAAINSGSFIDYDDAGPGVEVYVYAPHPSFTNIPTVRTQYAKLVVHFGGRVFEHGPTLAPVSTTSTYNDAVFHLDIISSLGSSPVASTENAPPPVMQGMCPYIAYRRPNTAQAEMICAHSSTIPNHSPTTYVNSTFTEAGVEDWLTSCGVPAAVTTRVATCFRVGGPHLSNEA